MYYYKIPQTYNSSVMSLKKTSTSNKEYFSTQKGGAGINIYDYKGNEPSIQAKLKEFIRLPRAQQVDKINQILPTFGIEDKLNMETKINRQLNSIVAKKVQEDCSNTERTRNTLSERLKKVFLSYLQNPSSTSTPRNISSQQPSTSTTRILSSTPTSSMRYVSSNLKAAENELKQAQKQANQALLRTKFAQQKINSLQQQKAQEEKSASQLHAADNKAKALLVKLQEANEHLKDEDKTTIIGNLHGLLEGLVNLVSALKETPASNVSTQQLVQVQETLKTAINSASAGAKPEELQKSLNSATQTLEETERELKDAESDADKKLKELEAKTKLFEAEKASLLKEAQEAKEEARKARNEAQKAKAEAKTAANNKASSNTKLAEVTQKLEAEAKKVEEMTSQLDEKTKEMETTKSEITKLQEQISKTEQKPATNQSENAEKQSELMALQQKLAKLEQELAKEKADKLALEAKITDKSEKIIEEQKTQYSSWSNNKNLTLDINGITDINIINENLNIFSQFKIIITHILTIKVLDRYLEDKESTNIYLSTNTTTINTGLFILSAWDNIYNIIIDIINELLNNNNYFESITIAECNKNREKDKFRDFNPDKLKPAVEYLTNFIRKKEKQLAAAEKKDLDNNYIIVRDQTQIIADIIDYLICVYSVMAGYKKYIVLVSQKEPGENELPTQVEQSPNSGNTSGANNPSKKYVVAVSNPQLTSEGTPIEVKVETPIEEGQGEGQGEGKGQEDEPKKEVKVETPIEEGQINEQLVLRQESSNKLPVEEQPLEENKPTEEHSSEEETTQPTGNNPNQPVIMALSEESTAQQGKGKLELKGKSVVGGRKLTWKSVKRYFTPKKHSKSKTTKKTIQNK